MNYEKGQKIYHLGQPGVILNRYMGAPNETAKYRIRYKSKLEGEQKCIVDASDLTPRYTAE